MYLTYWFNFLECSLNNGKGKNGHTHEKINWKVNKFYWQDNKQLFKENLKKKN